MKPTLPKELICIITGERRDILCQLLGEYIGTHTGPERLSKSFREARIMFRALARAKCIG